MFNCSNLLIRQHGGKFCDAWLAATRGVQHIPKNKILTLNIVKICDDILVMIATSSNKASSRLSLGLSSRLINGTVKIHRRQAEIMLEEIIQILACVQKSQGILEITELCTPELPISRKQLKRKRQVKLTQENELEVLVRSNVLNVETTFELPLNNQADVDLITLREDLVTDTGRYNMSFGELGVFSDAEPFIQDVSFFSARPPTKDQTLKRITQEDIQPQTPSKRKRTSALIAEKTVTIPEIQVLPSEVEHEDLRETIADNQLEEIEIYPGYIVNEADVNIAPLRRIRKPRVNKINICVQRGPRFLAIDIKQNDEDFIFASKMDNQQQLKQVITLIEVDVPSLLTEFMEGTRKIERILAPSPGSTSSLAPSLDHSQRRQSKRLRDRTRSISIGEASMISLVEDEVAADVTPQILVPIEVHAPQSPDVTPPLQLNREKSILTPLAESVAINFDELENLPKRRTIERTASPAARDSDRRARRVLPFTSNDDDHSRKIQRKDRQKRIKNIVKNWTEGEITIEDVCNQPINRYNLAATFGDLLNLQAMGYIKLNSKANSVELGTIEEGPKLKLIHSI